MKFIKNRKETITKTKISSARLQNQPGIYYKTFIPQNKKIKIKSISKNIKLMKFLKYIQKSTFLTTLIKTTENCVIAIFESSKIKFCYSQFSETVIQTTTNQIPRIYLILCLIRAQFLIDITPTCTKT